MAIFKVWMVLKGQTKNRMPNCGLPSHGDIYLKLADNDDTIFQYRFVHGGANRDFVQVAGQSWGIKFELGRGKGHCWNEWQLYTSLPQLRKRVPQCFGFVKFYYKVRRFML